MARRGANPDRRRRLPGPALRRAAWSSSGHALRATTRSEARPRRDRGQRRRVLDRHARSPGHAARRAGERDDRLLDARRRASGEPDEVAALHSSRLEFFLGQAIDTTVRGFIYDAWPAGRRRAADLLASGERIVRSLAQLNAIPVAVLGGSRPDGGRGREDGAWLDAASPRSTAAGTALASCARERAGAAKPRSAAGRSPSVEGAGARSSMAVSADGSDGRRRPIWLVRWRSPCSCRGTA